MTHTTAVVVAAGSGERLGAGVPKALVPLAGRPLLSHALDRLRRSDVIDATVVVHPPDHEAAFADICRAHGIDALVPGGATRTDSVRAGVDAAPAETDRYAIHDAARALTPSSVIAAAVRAVTGEVIAAAPGLPVPDTLKRVRDGLVDATVDRTDVWAVHTPQVVAAEVYRRVLAWADTAVATDDLGLVERALASGVVAGEVAVVAGDVRDLKVTYERDLDVAAQLLAGEDRGSAPDRASTSSGGAA